VRDLSGGAIVIVSAITRLLAGVAAVEALVTLNVIARGAFEWDLGTFTISASHPARPFRIAVIAGAAAVWLSDRRRPVPTWRSIPAWAATAAAIAAVVTVAVGLRWAVGVAGGADAYGYVSQAALWARGNLFVSEPLAALDPSLACCASPLGYRPALDPGASVPTYSPGLPLLMAAALPFGSDAVYVVVPLLGGLAVWCTFLIGRRLAGPRTGLIAGLLTASSPLFLFHLFEPMSDLPVTAWWLTAMICAFAPSRRAAFGSGLTASAAVLTRPNLVPLALVVAALVARQPGAVRRVALFTVGLLPGCLAVAVVNERLYGSPFSSGYGPLGLLFSLDAFWPNLQRYPAWLIQLHTAGILIALAAPFLPAASRGAQNSERSDVGSIDRGAASLLLAFCLGVLASYVFYLVFPDWPALRFLLPAIPLLLVLASAVIVLALAYVPERARGAVVLLFVGLLGCRYVEKAESLGLFLIQESQRRYVTTGTFVDRTLPDNAVVLSVIQSGTMRMYGQRQTLRWDQLDAGALEPTIATLRSHRLEPYLLVEDGEEAAFRTHFSGASPLGQLDWPPAYELASQPIVRIYRPGDREKHISGERVATAPITRE
jgi:hypothetical protein